MSFILDLDQFIKPHDVFGTGVKYNSGMVVRVFVYADDTALLEPEVDDMIALLTILTDVTIREADIHVSMSKTLTQDVDKQSDNVTITAVETVSVQSKFDHKCDF